MAQIIPFVEDFIKEHSNNIDIVKDNIIPCIENQQTILHAMVKAPYAITFPIFSNIITQMHKEKQNMAMAMLTPKYKLEIEEALIEETKKDMVVFENSLKKLLSLGIDINLRNKIGRNAIGQLFYTKVTNPIQEIPKKLMLDVFLKYEADFGFEDQMGRTSLYYFLKNYNPSKIEDRDFSIEKTLSSIPNIKKIIQTSDWVNCFIGNGSFITDKGREIVRYCLEVDENTSLTESVINAKGKLTTPLEHVFKETISEGHIFRRVEPFQQKDKDFIRTIINRMFEHTPTNATKIINKICKNTKILTEYRLAFIKELQAEYKHKFNLEKGLQTARQSIEYSFSI